MTTPRKKSQPLQN